MHWYKKNFTPTPSKRIQPAYNERPTNLHNVQPEISIEIAVGLYVRPGTTHCSSKNTHGDARVWVKNHVTVLSGRQDSGPLLEGPLFRKSTILTNPNPNHNHNLNPNLNQTLALWRVSAQWTFGIAGRYRKLYTCKVDAVNRRHQTLLPINLVIHCIALPLLREWLLCWMQITTGDDCHVNEHYVQPNGESRQGNQQYFYPRTLASFNVSWCQNWCFIKTTCNAKIKGCLSLF